MIMGFHTSIPFMAGPVIITIILGYPPGGGIQVFPGIGVRYGDMSFGPTGVLVLPGLGDPPGDIGILPWLGGHPGAMVGDGDHHGDGDVHIMLITAPVVARLIMPVVVGHPIRVPVEMQVVLPMGNMEQTAHMLPIKMVSLPIIIVHTEALQIPLIA